MNIEFDMNGVGIVTAISCCSNTWCRGLVLGNAPNARILRWGYQHVGILEPTQTLEFALGIPTCWYFGANANPLICVLADAKPKICVLADAKPKHKPVEYRLHWVPGVGSLRWACTFHIFCVDFICVG